MFPCIFFSFFLLLFSFTSYGTFVFSSDIFGDSGFCFLLHFAFCMSGLGPGAQHIWQIKWSNHIISMDMVWSRYIQTVSDRQNPVDLV